MELKRIVVIGASAGGIKAINQFVSNLPADLELAIFIVIHMSKMSRADIIQQQLQKNTSYNCLVANDGEEIKAGNIYLSPADVHLLIKPGVMYLVRGPHENRWRPSIDVLFRSAAAAYGSNVIGVILSGMLDDGTSGMSAIKRSGGICIVQEPNEAEFMDMPVNVINNIKTDHRVLLEDMGYIIADILSKPVDTNVQVPEDVKIEAQINERMASSLFEMEKIGVHSNFSCPDCGGGLWKIKNESNGRYRCHTGHVYTEHILLEKQNEQMEESLWVSIRMLEERRNLLLNIAWREEHTEETRANGSYKMRAEGLDLHIERLKALLVSLSKNEPADKGYL
jgi:two-component system chemotaxis response regulator CheB